MAQDVGGLDYKIKVGDESGPAVQSFRDSIRAAKAEWRSFKDELQSRRGRTGNLDAELDRVARAADRAARATARAAAADRKASQDLGRRARGVFDANKQFDKKVRLDERSAVSAQRNFAAERRMASAARQRAQAEEAITRVVERRQRAENILNAARERGINLTQQEARSLKILTAEQERLLRARQRLAAVQQDAGNPELTRIKAETEAIRRQQAVRQKAATEAALAARGLDPTGQIKPIEQKGIAATIKNLLGLNKAMDDSDGKARRTGFTFRRLFGVFLGFTIIRQVTASFRDLVREIVSGNAAIEQQTLGLAAQIAAVGDVRTATGEAAESAEKLAIAEGEARKQVQALRIDALEAGLEFDGLLEAFTQALGPGLQAGFDVDQVRQFTKQISIAARTIGIEGGLLAEEVRSILSGNINPRNTRVAQALGITNDDIRQAKEAGTLFDFLTQKFEIYNLAAKKAGETFTGLVGRFRLGIRLIAAAGGLTFFLNLKTLLKEVTDQFAQVNKTTGELELNPNLVRIVEIVSRGLNAAVDEARRLIDTLSQGDVEAFALAFANLFTFTIQIISQLIEGAVTGIGLITSAVQFVAQAFEGLTGFTLFDNSILRTTVFLIGAIAGALLTVAAPLTGILLVVKGLQIGLAGLVAAGKAIRVLVAALNAIRVAAGLAKLSIASLAARFIVLLGIVIAAAAAIRLVNKGLEGDFESMRNTVSDGLAKLAVKNAAFMQAVVDSMAGVPVKEAFRRFQENLRNVDKEFEANKTNASLTQRVFGDLFTEAIQEVKKLNDELDKTFESGSTDGFVEAQSEAIKELKDNLKELTDQAKQARDNTQSTLAGLGLPAGIAEQAQSFGAAVAQGLRLSNNLLREREEVTRKIRAIEKERDTNLLPENFKAAELVALEERRLALNTAIQTAKKLVLDTTFAELEAMAAMSNEELRRTNNSLRIEASHARNLRLFELENDARALALEQTTQDLELAQEANIEAEAAASLSLATQREILEAARERVIELEKIAAIERTPEQNEDLDTARRLVDEKTRETQKLEEQIRLQRVLREEELNRLQIEQLKAQLAQEEPIGTGIVEGLQQAFDEVSDGFQTTVDIMRSTVRDFSAFIASSIVDAFDPTNDTDLQERFARFLQGLATQILTTLITLAITAIALNAASGGLLGPLLQGYATAGRSAGGPVAFGRHRGGRAAPPRSHRRFQKARGYNRGGSPSDRQEHGVLRPRGLHPRDTVPIWAAPKEWIIKESSVLKAGADAAQAFNEGRFHTETLRAALGLPSYRRTVSFARSTGPGRVRGGSVGTAAQAVAVQASPSSQADRRPVPAYITSGNDATKRLLTGGGGAMKDWLADNGYFPTQR